MQIFDFLKSLTAQKIANAVALKAGYLLAGINRKAIHWGMPASLSVEPTAFCNLHCPECPAGTHSLRRDKGLIDQTLYRNIIDQLAPKLSYLILYFQGEPYTHPQFFDLIAYARQKNIFTTSSTNGHFLTKENARKTIESGLNRLIVSIDGTTQEVYESYRKGGNLQTVLEGIENLIKNRQNLKSPTPKIELQFLVTRQNEHQIPDIQQLAKKLNVDRLKLKSAQLYDYKHGHPLMPKNTKYSRYRQVSDGTYQLKSKQRNRCWRLWQGAVISWDGLVVPCCFDKQAQYVMGDLKQQTFKEIWNNKPYKAFRQQILDDRQKFSICQNCTSP